jgi:hypothetical protein
VDRRGRLGVDIAECYPEWFAKVCVFVWYGCLRVVSLWSNERQYMYPHLYPPPHMLGVCVW